MRLPKVMRRFMPTEPARPSTILSPHGEGYCRHCRFIVGINEHGALDEHYRSRYPNEPQLCKGSLTRPPKVTPYASKYAAFKTTSVKVRCHVCQKTLNLMGNGRLPEHNQGYNQPYGLCLGSTRPPRVPLDPVDLRRHEGERG